MLALHFGLVLALFAVLPYSKMVHGIYRGIALLRNAQEKRAGVNQRLTAGGADSTIPQGGP